MIRARAGEREQRFHRVKPVHAAIFHFAAFDEAGDIIMRIIFAADEIAVE